MRTPTYKNNKKRSIKGKTQSRLPERYLSRKDFYRLEPIIDNDRNNSMLRQVSYWLRGFGYRHWRQLHENMQKNKFDLNFIKHIKLSFFKFKFARMLTPEASKNLIWIWKNCLDLNGQKFYNDSYDNVMDIGVDKWYYYTAKWDPKYTRLEEYFRNIDMSLWLPMNAFPLIQFKKDRMYLSELPKPEFDEKELYEKLFSFLTRIELTELFIPPPDILFKIGNQLYNDNGVPTKDYNRATKYDSNFLYQEFMAQPLQPRQVWLPGKKIKHNNIFWMIVGRQFLSRLPAYPSTDPEKLFERFKGKWLDVSRFDISGFGFQFPREYLIILTRVIRELYPCTPLEMMGEELENLFNKVSVDMPNGEVKHPPRGTGLGYYEDLKTLVMMALLDQYQPISVYGDQGIMDTTMGLMAMFELQRWGFVFKDDDKFITYSSTGTSPYQIKWAGYQIDANSIRKSKDIINPLIGALFLEQHWERKNSLMSFAKENKDIYAKYEKRIIRAYELYHGSEFYRGELTNSFEDGVGISLKAKPTFGFKKDYKMKDFRVPYSDTFFEVPFATPFKRRNAKIWPKGIGKEFSIQRQRIFKSSPFIDSSVYYYSNPRIEYNNVYRADTRMLPEWAEFLYIFMHNSSSGSFTHNLTPEKLDNAIQNYQHSPDPIRALKQGGYRILDFYHRKSIPSEEWLRIVERLKTVERRQLDYIQRADIPTSIQWAEDPMYYTEDLYRPFKKAKITSKTNQPVSHDRKAVANLLKSKLAKNVGTGVIQSLPDLLNFQEECEDHIVTEEEEFILGEEDIFMEDIYDIDFTTSVV
jgi:hypothetical protein